MRFSSRLHHLQLVSGVRCWSLTASEGRSWRPYSVADRAPFGRSGRRSAPFPHYSLRYATLAGLLGGGLVWLGPPGIDLAAHLYQHALFDERGFTFWNNFWYAGRYSYVNYSLLYYPLAALVGLKVLATASVAVGASAFGLTVERFWGGCARWAAWAFAVAPSPPR